MLRAIEAEVVIGGRSGEVSQSRCRLCLAVSLAVAGVYGGGKCRDDPAATWSDLGRGGAGSFTLAARGRVGATRASPLGRAFGRGATTGGSGAGAHYRSEIAAGR